jgi:hypothetical protein
VYIGPADRHDHSENAACGDREQTPSVSVVEPLVGRPAARGRDERTQTACQARSRLERVFVSQEKLFSGQRHAGEMRHFALLETETGHGNARNRLIS